MNGISPGDSLPCPFPRCEFHCTVRDDIRNQYVSDKSAYAFSNLHIDLTTSINMHLSEPSDGRLTHSPGFSLASSDVLTAPLSPTTFPPWASRSSPTAGIFPHHSLPTLPRYPNLNTSPDGLPVDHAASSIQNFQSSMANFSRSTLSSVSGDQLNINRDHYVVNLNNISSDSLVSIRSTGSGVIASVSPASSSNGELSPHVLDTGRRHDIGGRLPIGRRDSIPNCFVELQNEFPESEAQRKMQRPAVLKRGQYILAPFSVLCDPDKVSLQP